MKGSDGPGLHSTALRLFSGLAGTYDAVVDLATMYQDRRWKEWVRSQMPPEGGGLTLDVGCGTLLLERRLANGGRKFVGVDLSREMASAGREKNLPNVELVVNGDAEALPFPDGAFDSVVSCYVAKYVAVEVLARELWRVAKPGAAIVLYDFAKPMGMLSPFIGAYIRGGLGVAGLLARLADLEVAYTFTELPKIIYGTEWDRELVPAMEARGFETLTTGRLTGGVVFAYSGRKRG